MSSTTTTIIAEFAVYGVDLNPEQLTATLGIEPTKSWFRGDIRNHRTNATYDYGCWKICTDQNKLSLEEHFGTLAQRLAENADLLSVFAAEKEHEVELSVIVRIAEEAPDISLSKKAVEWLCGLGARLDIDTYL